MLMPSHSPLQTDISCRAMALVSSSSTTTTTTTTTTTSTSTGTTSCSSQKLAPVTQLWIPDILGQRSAFGINPFQIIPDYRIHKPVHWNISRVFT